MMHDPAVTVLMGVRNDARFVGAAVESILSQTFTNYEFIVIDDASTDDTAAVLKRHADPRIRVTRNEDQLGLTRSLNRGIELSRGPYIARMDSDDVALPTRLERQYRYLEAHPDIGVLGSAVQGINAVGEAGNVMRFPSSHEEIVWRMLFECVIAHPTVMFRRELVDRHGCYDPEYVFAQDAELWVRLAAATRFANLEEPLLLRRWHGSSIGNRQTGQQLDFGQRARQHLMEQYAGRSIAPPVMRVLSMWSGLGPGSVDATLCTTSMDLLLELYDNWSSMAGASARVRTAVHEDMVRRMLSLARVSSWPPGVCYYLVRKLRHDTAVVARLGWRYLAGHES